MTFHCHNAVGHAMSATSSEFNKETVVVGSVYDVILARMSRTSSHVSSVMMAGGLLMTEEHVIDSQNNTCNGIVRSLSSQQR